MKKIIIKTKIKMKKIIIISNIFSLVNILNSCTKEISEPKSISNNTVHNYKSTIIDESNFENFLDNPDVKFFSQDLIVARIESFKENNNIFTLCVNSSSGTLCRNFRSKIMLVRGQFIANITDHCPIGIIQLTV